MKRRNFILLSTAGAMAIGATGWYLKYYTPKYDNLVNVPEALSHIWDDDTITAIGNRYRKLHTDENSEKLLVSHLLSDVDTEIDAIKIMKDKISNDFDTGNTELIEGWILSKTEARQCALFSITQQS